MLESAKYSKAPLLLFYPTSPVHVEDLRLLADKLPGWRFRAIVYRPLARVAPGIDDVLRKGGIDSVAVDGHDEISRSLPDDAAAMLLPAVFEPFALEVMAWGKRRRIPVIAIEEVAQLALNQLDINNYDAPFDRLFVASAEESRLFQRLGYPADRIRISGLLANDRITACQSSTSDGSLASLGVIPAEKVIVYTTSPIKSRLALHNKDDAAFRAAVLEQLARASHSTGRKVLIKLHPNEDIEANLSLIRRIIPGALVLDRKTAMDRIFPQTAVLVNRGNSQTCLEAVLRGVPTVVAAAGLRTLFHSDGGAYVVEQLSDLSRTIITALAQGAPDASRVRDNHFAFPAGGVAGFIAREIDAMADTSWVPDRSSWDWIIRSMLFMGRQDRALALCESTEFVSPWRVQVRTALKAHALGQTRDAVDAWERCAALEPSWYYPYYELAHGFLALDEPVEALAHAEKANALHPPFHSLWHEIPMEIVAMAALRKLGRREVARERLKKLDHRGLIDIVPELIIEAAAQEDVSEDGNRRAEQYLSDAVLRLKSFPVNESLDRDITRRVVFQYLELAARQADLKNDEEAAACLRKAACLASSDAELRDQFLRHLAAVTESRSRQTNDVLLREGRVLARHQSFADPSLRLVLARLEFQVRRYRQALRELHQITRMPGGTRAVAERILSPRAAARLAHCWPESTRAIIKPIKLVMLAFGWFVRRAVFETGSLREGALLFFLVFVHVGRHFVRRWRTETAKLRRFSQKIQAAAWAGVFKLCARATNCPICGGGGRFEYRNKLSPLFRCRCCDHVYARDLPDDEALSALYGDFSYWEKDKFHQGITKIEASEQWEVYLNARIGILQKLKFIDPAESPGKRVFEIGCAEGMLLHEISKRGFEVAGCEMNRSVAAQGVRQLGVKILTEPFERLNLAPEHFDLVISFHTLEHMRNPVAVLARAARILRPGGAILIEVPCGEEEYDNTDHLHFFSEKSLRVLLQRYFVDTEILPNGYTNSAGVHIGSIYGVGRGVGARDDAAQRE